MTLYHTQTIPIQARHKLKTHWTTYFLNRTTALLWSYEAYVHQIISILFDAFKHYF